MANQQLVIKKFDYRTYDELSKESKRGWVWKFRRNGLKKVNQKGIKIILSRKRWIV